MNAADHFREAERDVERADSASLRDGEAAYMVARAQVHATLALAAIQRPTHTVGGDEFIYDGIGKAEINRLRSLLAHEDRDRLTTWEVVEVAADELAAARQAVSS